MDTIEERISELEKADVNQLRSVDIEDVYVQMDRVLAERPSPLDLYFRWERQHWQTQQLDFAEDRAHWELLMPEMRTELQRMGYRLDFQRLTSGPINAIWFDRKHGTFWGGSSNHGEDYGIAW